MSYTVHAKMIGAHAGTAERRRAVGMWAILKATRQGGGACTRYWTRDHIRVKLALAVLEEVEKLMAEYAESLPRGSVSREIFSAARARTHTLAARQ